MPLTGVGNAGKPPAAPQVAPPSSERRIGFCPPPPGIVRAAGGTHQAILLVGCGLRDIGVRADPMGPDAFFPKGVATVRAEDTAPGKTGYRPAVPGQKEALLHRVRGTKRIDENDVV